MDGLRDMVGGDFFGALQVGYGAGDFQDADLGVGEEELEFRNGPFHGRVRGKIQSKNPLS